MKQLHATLLAAACALALSACGGESRQAADTASVPPPAPAVETAPPPPPAPPPMTDSMADASTTPGAAAPADATAPTMPAEPGTPTADTAAAAGPPAAAAGGCSTEIEGNDRMQYNLSSITVPSSCSEFTITLKHVGQLPVAAMGHNVVITKASDMAGVAADGVSAGAGAGYLKAGDSRVIAHTEMIGGGQTSAVTFKVDKIRNGSFQFFCSFPGHAALMKGTIAVQ